MLHQIMLHFMHCHLGFIKFVALHCFGLGSFVACVLPSPSLGSHSCDVPRRAPTNHLPLFKTLNPSSLKPYIFWRPCQIPILVTTYSLSPLFLFLLYQPKLKWRYSNQMVVLFIKFYNSPLHIKSWSFLPF